MLRRPSGLIHGVDLGAEAADVEDAVAMGCGPEVAREQFGVDIAEAGRRPIGFHFLEARIEEDGGFELVEQLAGDYWDLTDPERAETLEMWRAFKDLGFRKVVLEPSRIRTHQPDQAPPEE
jgi:hypothetical protein